MLLAKIVQNLIEHLHLMIFQVKMDKLSGNPLEQFVLLSKSAKGAAAVELIKQALEAPGVYVFGELLDMPNIKEVCFSAKKYVTNRFWL